MVKYGGSWGDWMSARCFALMGREDISKLVSFQVGRGKSEVLETQMVWGRDASHCFSSHMSARGRQGCPMSAYLSCRDACIFWD